MMIIGTGLASGATIMSSLCTGADRKSDGEVACRFDIQLSKIIIHDTLKYIMIIGHRGSHPVLP